MEQYLPVERYNREKVFPNRDNSKEVGAGMNDEQSGKSDKPADFRRFEDATRAILKVKKGESVQIEQENQNQGRKCESQPKGEGHA